MSDRELITIDPTQFSALVRTLAEGFKSVTDNEVLNAIHNLERKVDQFMTTQEERLQSIQTALTGVADGVNTLQQQIADLKANNPALDDEISAIESTVKGIADDINGVVPAPPVEG